MNNALLVFLIILFVLSISSCQYREKIVNRSKLTGDDYRLFQQTDAWDLAKAVEDNKSNKIEEILSKNPSLVDFQDPTFGKTLLMLSIGNQQFKSFKTLIENKANVNLYDTFDGLSAIIEACRYKDYDVKFVKTLIQFGANVNDIEIGNRRNGNTTRKTPLISACRSGNLDIVKVLIKNGANINFQNEYGQSPLNASLLQGEYDISYFLLELGADFTKPVFVNNVNGKETYIRELFAMNKSEAKKTIVKKIISFVDSNE